MNEQLAQIKAIYGEIKPVIDKRILEYKSVWENGTEEEIFAELAFCLFTPQSKAVSCWKAVNILRDKGLLFAGGKDEVAAEINIVRFRNNKAGYLIEAREKFSDEFGYNVRKTLSRINDIYERRDFLFKNVKGIGLKEAGHFLRNVGFVEELAILDRHILKNLVLLGVIKEVPKTLGTTTYYEIEKKMKEFSVNEGIDMGALDLVLWYREAGEVFK